MPKCDKYHAKWKANMAKCSKYHAKCKVTMPTCSKYHAKWQVLVPNCCKYKANGTGKESQKKIQNLMQKKSQNYSTPLFKFRSSRRHWLCPEGSAGCRRLGVDGRSSTECRGSGWLGDPPLNFWVSPGKTDEHGDFHILHPKLSKIRDDP